MKLWHKTTGWVWLALLLAAPAAHAQMPVWTNNFQTAANWSVTSPWRISAPSAGPPLSGGYRTYEGAPQCANTQNYGYSEDADIYCINYGNGSNTLVVPSASVSPTLSYWAWYNFDNALGYVEIHTVTNGWQPLSGDYNNADGQWAQTVLDLSPYAGQSVQIGFHFTSGCCFGNFLGWFINNVAVMQTVTTPPTLVVPTNLTIYAGQTMNAPVYATNALLPNAIYSYRLLAGPAKATMAADGVITWTLPDTQPDGTTNFTVEVTDNSTPTLSATNSFTVTVINQWMPVLTMPATQTIYAGQYLSVTIGAANPVFPNDTFTFGLVTTKTNTLTTMTNLDEPDIYFTDFGIFNWQSLTNQKAGTYTVVVEATDNSPPNYSATNSFQIVVLTNPPPPTVAVPATQTLYVGQPLDVTISADSVFSQSTFMYGPTNLPYGAVIDPNSGELTWTPSLTNALHVIGFTVTATDSTSDLTGSNTFEVIVSPAPLPSLTVPSIITNYAGQTLAIPLTATNNTGLDTAGFSFVLLSYTNDAWITYTNDPWVSASTNDLIWTNTGITSGRLVWYDLAPSNYIMSIRVTDQSTLESATDRLQLVLLPPLPPTILVPTNPSVAFGSTNSIQLSATNEYVLLPNVKYAFGLTNTANNSSVIVTTNGLLTWTNTTAPPGAYPVTVEVTDNSFTELSATDTFIVSVLPPSSQLLLTNTAAAAKSGQPFFLGINTPWTNFVWQVYATTNLAGGSSNWVSVYTNQTGPSGTLWFTDLLSTNYLKRFYRAGWQPLNPTQTGSGGTGGSGPTWRIQPALNFFQRASR